MASSIGNISNASSDSEEKRQSKKLMSSSRRTVASECNVNVTPERTIQKEASDVSDTYPFLCVDKLQNQNLI